MKTHRLSPFSLPLLTLVSILALSGCSEGPRGSNPSPPMMPPPTPPNTSPDAAVMPPQADAEPGSTPDASEPTPTPETNARLTGWVTRSTAPRAGGRGSLYVALFDQDPVLMRDSASRVAESILESTDFSSDGARYEYSIEGIPPRAEPYFVIAFLDDNGTVDTSTPSLAGPDRGDLVSLDGFSSPQITLSTPEPVLLDLDLNFSLPF